MEPIKRRKFIDLSVKAAGAVTFASLVGSSFDVFALANENVTAFTFSQISLPYAYNALEPAIDAMTMEIHYTKHHATYVKNVNDAIKVENLTYKNELEFFSNASKLSAKVRNNAGGVWNHNFFWESMRPGPATKPTGKLKDAIDKSFGSLANLKDEFGKAALGQFVGKSSTTNVVDFVYFKILFALFCVPQFTDNSLPHPVKVLALAHIVLFLSLNCLKAQLFLSLSSRRGMQCLNNHHNLS
ncbi:MAG: superoxide dismutase [Pedobacter sp.]|nr:MAG: superoxide dismutase [Pedobacter sp.]